MRFSPAIRLATLALLSACAITSRAQLAIPPANPFLPTIAGVPVWCTSYWGQPVAFFHNAALPDVGRAMPGAPPTIELNPYLLAQFPPALQLFIYGHECAHHVLGPYNSEVGADCWSITTGKRQGWLRREDVLQLEPYFRNNPGSPWGHLPGPMRSQAFLACFDNA